METATTATLVRIIELGPHAYQILQYIIGAFFIWAMIFLIFVPVIKTLASIWR